MTRDDALAHAAWLDEQAAALAMWPMMWALSAAMEMQAAMWRGIAEGMEE